MLNNGFTNDTICQMMMQNQGHMLPINSCSLPQDALLARYNQNQGYTDCYTTEIAGPVSHARFVKAFYTTPLFRTEALILRWAIGKPSTHAQAAELAQGQRDAFAAWTVEARAPDQLLLCDVMGRTRSWLMVEPVATDGVHQTTDGTRLYFGSAVVPRLDRQTGKARMGWLFSALLGFHRLYSILLLYSARKRLEAGLR